MTLPRAAAFDAKRFLWTRFLILSEPLPSETRDVPFFQKVPQFMIDGNAYNQTGTRPLPRCCNGGRKKLVFEAAAHATVTKCYSCSCWCTNLALRGYERVDPIKPGSLDDWRRSFVAADKVVNQLRVMLPIASFHIPHKINFVLRFQGPVSLRPGLIILRGSLGCWDKGDSWMGVWFIPSFIHSFPQTHVCVRQGLDIKYHVRIFSNGGGGGHGAR